MNKISLNWQPNYNNYNPYRIETLIPDSRTKNLCEIWITGMHIRLYRYSGVLFTIYTILWPIKIIVIFYTGMSQVNTTCFIHDLSVLGTHSGQWMPAIRRNRLNMRVNYWKSHTQNIAKPLQNFSHTSALSVYYSTSNLSTEFQIRRNNGDNIGITFPCFSTNFCYEFSLESPLWGNNNK